MHLFLAFLQNRTKHVLQNPCSNSHQDSIRESSLAPQSDLTVKKQESGVVFEGSNEALAIFNPESGNIVSEDSKGDLPVFNQVSNIEAEGPNGDLTMFNSKWQVGSDGQKEDMEVFNPENIAVIEGPYEDLIVFNPASGLDSHDHKTSRAAFEEARDQLSKGHLTNDQHVQLSSDRQGQLGQLSMDRHDQHGHGQGTELDGSIQGLEPPLSQLIMEEWSKVNCP